MPTKTLILLSLNTATAHYWLPRYEREFYVATYEEEQSPRWTASTDAYVLNVPLPAVDEATLSAALSADGKKIELIGEKQIEGCTCRPTTVQEVSLPYRPRAEDIDVIAKDGSVSLRLARHAGSDGPTPLTVKVEKKAPPKEEDGATRKLRFVPHESATSTTLEQREKSLTDKFRSAALASVATTRIEKAASTKDADEQGALHDEATGSSSASAPNAEATNSPTVMDSGKKPTEQASDVP